MGKNGGLSSERLVDIREYLIVQSLACMAVGIPLIVIDNLPEVMRFFGHIFVSISFIFVVIIPFLFRYKWLLTVGIIVDQWISQAVLNGSLGIITIDYLVGYAYNKPFAFPVTTIFIVWILLLLCALVLRSNLLAVIRRPALIRNAFHFRKPKMRDIAVTIFLIGLILCLSGLLAFFTKQCHQEYISGVGLLLIISTFAFDLWHEW